MAAPGLLGWLFGSSGPPGPAAVAADRIRSLIQLLPPGKLWRLEPTSTLYKLLSAISDELDRVRARYLQLMEERDPRTASETIEQWEAALSLPDEQVPTLPTSLAERRAAVTQKYTSTGGQDLAYFTSLTLACGYPLVSIAPGGRLLRAGFRCGAVADGTESRCYAEAWGYTCVITVGTASPPALSPTQLEAVLRAALHAHLSLLVVYA